VATPSANRAFESFLSKFEKSHLTPLTEAETRAPYKVISTGSFALDYALGVGGWVEGRLVEIWGNDSIGKTTFSLVSVAEAQKAYPKKQVAFIDMEQTFDLGLAKGVGVDTSRLWVFTPSSAEAVADAVKDIISSGFFSMVVLDSVGAMIPEAEKEKDADEAVVAIQAKIVTRMVKIAAVECAKTDTIFILLNQVRSLIGAMRGPTTTTGGGWALKHVTTHKVQLSRTGTKPYEVRIDGEDRVVGYELRAKVERNKVAPPHRIATFNLFNQATDRYGPRGVDRVDEVITLGMRRDVGMIQHSGSWYTLVTTGEQVQGLDKMKDLLRSQPGEMVKIREAAVSAVAHEVHAEDEDPDDEPEESAESDEAERLERIVAKAVPQFRKGDPSDEAED